MAGELAQKLIEANAVEVLDAEKDEFRLDLESVLKSYIETERRIHEEAQDVIRKRSMDFSALGRVRREIAKKYNFGLDDEAIDWITDQLIEMLYHTTHVEEVWADNNEIRRISRPVIEKHTAVDDELDAEVRKRIKNLAEGSVAWDIKYQQVLNELKKKKGL